MLRWRGRVAAALYSVSASLSSDKLLAVEDGMGAHLRYRWGMKEEDDMSIIGFSVQEEDEDGAGRT